ncbi:hypothetical protein C0J52_26224 [Blattella germanica]|nr:hypothetical protein C0J52_26224 [Blattella germanica]
MINRKQILKCLTSAWTRKSKPKTSSSYISPRYFYGNAVENPFRDMLASCFFSSFQGLSEG